MGLAGSKWVFDWVVGNTTPDQGAIHTEILESRMSEFDCWSWENASKGSDRKLIRGDRSVSGTFVPEAKERWVTAARVQSETPWVLVRHKLMKAKLHREKVLCIKQQSVEEDHAYSRTLARAFESGGGPAVLNIRGLQQLVVDARSVQAARQDLGSDPGRLVCRSVKCTGQEVCELEARPGGMAGVRVHGAMDQGAGLYLCSGSGSGSTLGAWNAPASFWRWVPPCGHVIRPSSPNPRTVSTVVESLLIILCLYCIYKCIRRPHNIWRCHTGILPCGRTVLVRCFVYFDTFFWSKLLRTLLCRAGAHFWFWLVWSRWPSSEWHVDGLVFIFCCCCRCLSVFYLLFVSVRRRLTTWNFYFRSQFSVQGEVWLSLVRV